MFSVDIRFCHFILLHSFSVLTFEVIQEVFGDCFLYMAPLASIYQKDLKLSVEC